MPDIDLPDSEVEEPANLGLSTYRGFYLIRDEVRQTIECAAERTRVGIKDLREKTSMGTVHCESALRFARATGLLNRGLGLSTFGELVNRMDASLQDISTQWVLHYHMSRPHTHGALFWPAFFQKCSEQVSLSNESLRAYAARSAGTGVAENSRAVKYAVTAFTSTYSKSDALGALRLIDVSGGSIVMGEPVAPNRRVVSYIVADYWKAQWGDRKTINLTALTEPGGLASILLMSSGDIGSGLSDMSELGLVEVHRRIHPYQVVRLWDNPEEILENLYED